MCNVVISWLIFTADAVPHSKDQMPHMARSQVSDKFLTPGSEMEAE